MNSYIFVFMEKCHLEEITKTINTFVRQQSKFG